MGAAEHFDATVYDMRFVKPLDEETVLQAAREHELIVTVDENAVGGGAGGAIDECLAAHDVQARVLNLGLPDRYIDQGGRGDMIHDAGLDAEGIVAAVAAFEHRAQPASSAAS